MEYRVPAVLAKRVCIACVLLVLVVYPHRTSCQSVSESLPSLPTVAAATSDAAQRIRIGPGDLLEVSVFDVPELNQPVRVSDTGHATLNLIGSVQLQNLSPLEAAQLISKKLREGNYVLHPEVSVLIREYGTQGVSVLGEVKHPGIYQVLGKRTLLDIVSQAGGTTAVAAQQATVRRRSGEQIVVSLSNDPNELLATNTELLPGDTVVVPRAGMVYVLGNVGRPGGFVMQNSGKVTVLQAIAYAGGTSPTASLSKAKIIRKAGAGYEEIKVNVKKMLKGKISDFELQQDDIVYVPPSSAKSLLSRTPSLVQAATSAAVYRAVE